MAPIFGNLELALLGVPGGMLSITPTIAPPPIPIPKPPPDRMEGKIKRDLSEINQRLGMRLPDWIQVDPEWPIF